VKNNHVNRTQDFSTDYGFMSSKSTRPTITIERILIFGLVLMALTAALVLITDKPDQEEESAPASTSTPTSIATPGLTPSVGAQNQPDGKIVFTCQITRQQGQEQICLIEVDGGKFRQLTDDPGHSHIFPSLAPDGHSVVFVSDRTGAFEIYELVLEGDLQQLTNDLGDLFAPQISPNGGAIVFTRAGNLNGSSIWVVARDGSDPRQVSEPPGAGAWDPVWSPDGSQLLFAGGSYERPQLYIMNSDGSDMRQITDIDGLHSRSDWSSDGITLAIYQGERWQREIILLNPAGTAIQQITNGGNNMAPSFSPGGRWIAFTSYMDNFQNEDGCEIYIMRIDGSDIRRLTINDYCDWQPRWGP
jgi:TolB protein